jgi:acyl-CoA thioesterase
MNSGNTPEAMDIVQKGMYNKDAFSKWLGITLLEIKPGSAKLSMTVRAEMTNGFGIAHGGIVFSLADSALAFAANAHGREALTLESTIVYCKPVKNEEKLLCIAEEENLSNKTGVYMIRIFNQQQELVASFRGLVYRSSKEWTQDKLK